MEYDSISAFLIILTFLFWVLSMEALLIGQAGLYQIAVIIDSIKIPLKVI